MPEAPRRYNPLRGMREAGLIRRSPRQESDERRGSAASRGYNARWSRSSKVYLDHNPLCVCCAANGRVTAATLVDHIIPARRRPDLFWKRSNWQGLCGRCHNVVKRALELQLETGECDEAALNLARPLPLFFEA